MERQIQVLREWVTVGCFRPLGRTTAPGGKGPGPTASALGLCRVVSQRTLGVADAFESSAPLSASVPLGAWPKRGCSSGNFPQHPERSLFQGPLQGIQTSTPSEYSGEVKEHLLIPCSMQVAMWGTSLSFHPLAPQARYECCHFYRGEGEGSVAGLLQAQPALLVVFRC